MAKAYWVSCYRSISNPDAVAAYAKLAGPALAAAGGRFLARGIPAQTYEAGVKQRMVLVEFDSMAVATACHDHGILDPDPSNVRVIQTGLDRDYLAFQQLNVNLSQAWSLVNVESYAVSGAVRHAGPVGPTVVS